MSKTKRLGKGLGELLGKEVMEEKNTESISISLVVPNEWQPRREFEPESLNALAESIKEHGVVQPVIVRKKDSGYELIAGERRLRAAQLAGLVEIPALVRDYSDQETAEIALIENLQREDLNPLEEGLAYQRMISEYHFTQEKMANLIGKSRSYVTNMMRLLELSEEVKPSFGAEIDGGTGASPFRIGNTCRADRACAPNCGRRSFRTAYRGNPPP